MDDIIFVNRKTGQVVPEGYPNAEAYYSQPLMRRRHQQTSMGQTMIVISMTLEWIRRFNGNPWNVDAMERDYVDYMKRTGVYPETKEEKNE